MDLKLITQRIINILINPTKEWDAIKAEKTESLKDLYLKFGLIISLVPAVIISFITFIVGLYYMIRYHFTIGGLFKGFFLSFGFGVLLFVLLSGSIFLIGLLLDKLSAQFKGNSNNINSHKLSIYSLTPVIISSTLFLLAFVFKSLTEHLVLIVSLYAVYIFATGAIKMKEISKDMLIPYTAVFALAWIILFELSFFISQQILY